MVPMNLVRIDWSNDIFVARQVATGHRKGSIWNVNRQGVLWSQAPNSLENSVLLRRKTATQWSIHAFYFLPQSAPVTKNGTRPSFLQDAKIRSRGSLLINIDFVLHIWANAWGSDNLTLDLAGAITHLCAACKFDPQFKDELWSSESHWNVVHLYWKVAVIF